MRPIANFTLHAALAAALAALAATSAAAAADYYLKFDTVKGESAAKAGGGKQLEIESWSWGATIAAKFGAVSGAHRDDSVTAPAEKRQHGWVTVSKPVDRGSLRVKVKLPWLACKVGDAFPDATLQNDAGRYELKDIQVTGCAPDGVSLNYKKVTVRGWDPEKKED